MGASAKALMCEFLLALALHGVGYLIDYGIAQDNPGALITGAVLAIAAVVWRAYGHRRSGWQSVACCIGGTIVFLLAGGLARFSFVVTLAVDVFAGAPLSYFKTRYRRLHEQGRLIGAVIEDWMSGLGLSEDCSVRSAVYVQDGKKWQRVTGYCTAQGLKSRVSLTGRLAKGQGTVGRAAVDQHKRPLIEYRPEEISGYFSVAKWLMKEYKFKWWQVLQMSKDRQAYAARALPEHLTKPLEQLQAKGVWYFDAATPEDMKDSRIVELAEASGDTLNDLRSLVEQVASKE